jgi:hypothetical protein
MQITLSSANILPHVTIDLYGNFPMWKEAKVQSKNNMSMAASTQRRVGGHPGTSWERSGGSTRKNGYQEEIKYSDI